ncbi:MAG: NAD(P)H-dependent oxidoreductase subunit E [Anaerolineales bacterium]|nr:NAD(P)H-dependent oxidoreductase subunit E [Anaerolineales bacterium]
MKTPAAEISGILMRLGERAPLLYVLEEIQKQYRYLPQDAMLLVSTWFGIPLSQIYSVATFYNAFTLVPQGKHTVQVCTGTACHVRGSLLILYQLTTKLGIQAGETTPDQEFTLETVNCLGCCALGPVSVLDGETTGGSPLKKVDRLMKSTKPKRGANG